MLINPYHKEEWIEYSIGVVIIFLRFIARWRAVGLRSLQLDDLFIAVALIFWSGEIAMLEEVNQKGSNAGIPTEVRASMNAEEIHRLELGSKYRLVGWVMYMTTLWCIKASMICYFFRIVPLPCWQRTALKINSWLCAATYVVAILTIFLHCRPMHLLWQVNPDPGDLCTFSLPNYFAIGAGNIVTDIILLSIAIPLLRTLRIPLRKKLVVGILLCGGGFVIIATVLRIYFYLQSISGIDLGLIWAFRESCIALLVVNAPLIRTFFNDTEGEAAARQISSFFGSTRRGRIRWPMSTNFDTLEGSTNTQDRGSTVDTRGQKQEPRRAEVRTEKVSDGISSDIRSNGDGDRLGQGGWKGQEKMGIFADNMV